MKPEIRVLVDHSSEDNCLRVEVTGPGIRAIFNIAYERLEDFLAVFEPFRNVEKTDGSR